MHIDTPRIIDLQKIYDPRGSLTFVQNDGVLPFEVKRAFWIYDVPNGTERGSHAHIATQEFLIAVSGSFCVHLFDGNETLSFRLESPSRGLFVPAGYWLTLDHFSSGSVCLSLASHPYDETDYIRDFDQFISIYK